MKTKHRRHRADPVASAVKKMAKVGFAAADIAQPKVRGPRILIYHQIGAELGREMEVSVETFQDQLDWLAENATVVSIDAALDHRGDRGSERMVVLSFDDGYQDLYVNAFPLLKERGWPFMLYVTTGPVETGEPVGGEGEAAPLSWAEVREMARSGLVTIGAHTHTHADLRALDAAQVIEELDRSNGLIVEHLGESPRHFAYPWGFWSALAEKQVAQCYETAALGSVASLTSSTHPYRLPRIPIQKSDGLFFFKQKVKSGMRAEEAFRRFVKGYYTPDVEAPVERS
jgi:peptidoglycan/xylan/chitin deacetylase (PgdA/CDA1 family)